MKKMLLQSIHASLLAGQRILEIYEGKEDYQVDYKTDDSPLTLADSESHRIITEIIDKGSFNIPLLSEEGAELPFKDRNEWSRLWVIDPLDGTKEFINKNGEFTVNIALVDQGVPVMGVIYVPVHRNLYFASQGEGSFKTALSHREASDYNTDSSPEGFIHRADKIQGNRTRPATGSPVSIVASRSHLNDKTESIIKKMENEYGEINLVSAGSSLKICQVAEGKADFYPRLAPTMEWDTAAGNAIALEAGCSMIDADTKKSLVYNKENLLNPEFLVTAPWLTGENLV